MKRALAVAVKVQGQTIIIHQNIDAPDATSFEARGLKSTATSRSSQVIFQFLEQLDIPVGAVLQMTCN